MRVIAKSGDGNYYLSLNDDLEAAIADEAAKGRALLTTSTVVLMPQTSLHNVVGRNSWKWHFLTREETDTLLRRYGLPPANDPCEQLSNRRIFPEGRTPTRAASA